MQHVRLDRGVIAAAALEYVDQHGVEALTMRSLATELGCAPMAVYRHVANKYDLNASVVEHSLRSLDPYPLTLEWQTGLVAFFTGFHRLLVAHPAVAQIMALQPMAGPEATRHSELVLKGLTETGMSPEKAVDILLALSQYTLGASLPGTGKARIEAWRNREWSVEDRRALSEAQDHLVGRDEDGRFHEGLVHLIAGYSVSNLE